MNPRETWRAKARVRYYKLLSAIKARDAAMTRYFKDHDDLSREWLRITTQTLMEVALGRKVSVQESREALQCSWPEPSSATHAGTQ